MLRNRVGTMLVVGGLGPLVNEDGVDLWDILRSLNSSGVGRVHFI